MSSFNRGKCRGCGKEIGWIKMLFTNKNMPVDLKPQQMVMLLDDLPEGTISNFQPDRATMVKVYMPHWATCPKADKFKKKKERGEVYE